MAAGDLTTLANAKLWLGINTASDDAQIQRLITAASDFIAQYCRRNFAVTAYTQSKYNGNGNRMLVLRNWPLISVELLQIDNVTVPETEYTFYERMIYLKSRVFIRGLNNVTVNYTAGYTSTPPSVEQACIDLVALKYRERDRIGHASKSINGETVSFLIAEMHPNTRKVLDEFRDKVPA